MNPRIKWPLIVVLLASLALLAVAAGRGRAVTTASASSAAEKMDKHAAF